MDKLLIYSGYDQHGPHIFPVEMGGGNRHIKLATDVHPAIATYMADAKKIPGKTQLLIDAMGSGEWWGSNRNGDYFPEDQLNHHGDEYGHRTFPRLAHPFKHHCNKDPKKAYGDRVILSAYHPSMHRVQLIVAVFDDRCDDILRRVDNGDFPDVSMGCLPKGSPVFRADGRRVSIETIKEGDSVLTHRGRPRRVKSTMVRSHKGSIYHVKAYGHRDALVLTEEHPLWLIRQEQMECHPSSKTVNRGRKQHVCTPNSNHSKVGCAGCSTSPQYQFDWVRTDEARQGDYLATPVPDYKTAVKFTADQARLLGYYLAEGCVLRTKAGNPMAVQFCTNLWETETHEELYQLGDRLGLNVTEYDAEDRNGKYISIWDRSLAELCSQHCGEKALTKRLSSDLIGADVETLLLFLGAYANGDGGCYKGSLYLSTASEELSEQLRLVLARCGMIASVNEIVHKPSKLVPRETVEFQVWVGTDTAWNLTTSRHTFGKSDRLCSKRFFFTYEGVTYLVTPIESIEEDPYDGDVYNFEVEEDESYLVEGLSVHNCRVPYDQCSICGNKARTRREYCDDLKYRMNKILPDGRRVNAVNFKPKFFDISFVMIGAEKASHVLAKVASDRSALLSRSSAELGEIRYGRPRYVKGAEFKSATETKKSSIKKQVPLDVKSVEPILKGAPAVKAMEPRLPDRCIRQMASFPLSDIFSTLSLLGIDPKPEEFQKIILIRAGQEKQAYEYEARNIVFDEHSSEATKPSFDLGVEHVNEKIAHILYPHINDRSCFTPFLLNRLDKYAEDLPGTSSSPISHAIPVGAALAGLYAFIKAKSPTLSTSRWGQAMDRHPWLLPLLAATGVGAAAAGTELLSPRPLATDDVFDTKLASGYDPFCKEASKKLLVPLLMAPMAYMYSGVQRNRARRGERLNKFDRFIAQRPDIAAVASLVAGPAAVGKGQKLTRSLKRFMKTGSLYTDFGAFALTSGSKLLPAAVVGAMVDATIAKKIGKILEKRRDHANVGRPAK